MKLQLDGQRFAKLVVLAYAGSAPGNKGSKWKCRCDCGFEIVAFGGNLKRGHTRSCGCIPHGTERADLTGKRFGKLEALVFYGVGMEGVSLWRCRCDCGSVLPIATRSLVTGRSTSCGCARNESTTAANKKRLITHGQSKRRTYRIWSRMLERCQNPNIDHWKYYGGRGIKACDRWLKYENFQADMGLAPDGLTLDRIEVNGNYEPGNCRWATRAVPGHEQAPQGVCCMTSIEKRLAEISSLGYIVSICYGVCNCESHQGRAGFSVQLHERDSASRSRRRKSL